jgi:hypothetical protein
MLAQAGIQGEYALASGYSVWIPAFAGMTWPLFIHHLHCGGLLGITLHPLVYNLTRLFAVCIISSAVRMARELISYAR